jgi:hypothetical protein
MSSPSHRFIGWFPIAFPASVVAICGIWQKPKDWIGESAEWVLGKMTEPFNIAIILGLCAVLIAVWLFAYFKTAPREPDFADLPELLGQILQARPPSRPHAAVQPDDAVHSHTAGTLDVMVGDVSLSATGIVRLSGLYIGYIVVAAGSLKTKQCLEFAIVGYNGAAETIQISEITGRIRAGTGNLRDNVKLPPPLFQGLLNTGPGEEFVLQMRQDVSAEQAEEYLVALGDSKTVNLDLRELNIIVSSVSDSEKRMRLPLWDGVNLRRRDDVVSNRTNILSPPLIINESKFYPPTVTQTPNASDAGEA